MLKFGLVLVLLSMTSLAQAKDVSAQQVGVEYARGNLEKAEAEYKDNLQRVSDSEKRLADAQKRLAEDRQKAADLEKESGRVQSEIRKSTGVARSSLETTVILELRALNIPVRVLPDRKQN